MKIKNNITYTKLFRITGLGTCHCGCCRHSRDRNSQEFSKRDWRRQMELMLDISPEELLSLLGKGQKLTGNYTDNEYFFPSDAETKEANKIRQNDKLEIHQAATGSVPAEKRTGQRSFMSLGMFPRKFSLNKLEFKVAFL